MILNGENYRAKEVLNRESSVVFVLAVNFMELLLLADLSTIYYEHEDQMDLNQLMEASRDISERYGPDLY
jgi:hypothetical protein